ncbi:MAG: RNA 2',3'-cyclic phosphodiesterase [Deltaproteobacteria bacterium]|nr:RNA 2',3'-cyclic phosphodiesterase [Deltaproteobacteria bacterium]
MEIRCFLAFELPPTIREILSGVSRELRISSLNARWVHENNIHLTVVFLGDVADEHIPSMGAGIEKVCLKTSPFHISLTGIGFFPTRRQPRVLWLGLNGDMERMSLFRDDLQRVVTPFGVREEKRPFKPHLTLGRFRRFDQGSGYLLDRFLTRYGDLTSPPGALRELVLFRSDLKPAGAVYTPLFSWPLAGDPQGTDDEREPRVTSHESGAGGR